MVLVVTLCNLENKCKNVEVRTALSEVCSLNVYRCKKTQQLHIKRFCRNDKCLQRLGNREVRETPCVWITSKYYNIKMYLTDEGIHLTLCNDHYLPLLTW